MKGVAMSSVLTPDLCIIGDSAGGVRAALLAAAFGVPTILIRTGTSDEKRALFASRFAAASNLAHRIRNATDFGLQAGQCDVDVAALTARLAADAQLIATRFSNARFAALGVRVMEGTPRFESTEVLCVDAYRIAARRFILALDTEPAQVQTDGDGSCVMLTPETIDSLEALPKNLIVMGHDADALIYAQSFARFGVTTSLVAADGLLPHEDPEQIAIVETALKRDGVVVHAHRGEMTDGRADGGRLAVGGAALSEKQAILNCMRTMAPLDQLGLAMAGIGSGPGGIAVDDRLRTSNRAVFAIGPCTSVWRSGDGLAALRAQADLVMRHVLFRLPLRYDSNRIPRAYGTDPEFAAVGLTEAEARRRCGSLSVLRSPFSENDLARTDGGGQGHVKILLDRRGRVLGASLTGPHARELVIPWASTIGAKPASIRQTVPPAPSYAETPRRALLEAYAPLARSKMVRAISAILRRIG